MIFSRGRGKTGRHARAEDEGRSRPKHAAPDGVEEPDEYEDRLEHGPGPYDIAEAPDGVSRLDLGSLLIPAIDGVEVRMQASQDGTVQQVVLISGESAMQLAVLAAPRSESIWDEVRDELRRSLVNDGARVEEVPGEYGPELRARVRTPEGQRDLRLVGIDGPRWMVHVVFQGRVAVDPGAAGPLAECLAGLVVNRGQEAMPVREALPLRLPREMAEAQAAQAAEQGQGQPGQGQPGQGQPGQGQRPPGPGQGEPGGGQVNGRAPRRRS